MHAAQTHTVPPSHCHDKPLWERKRKKKKTHWYEMEKRAKMLRGFTPDHFVYLCELLGFVVERVHDFAHILNCFQGCLICFVHWRLLKYNQDPFTLVKDSCDSVINILQHDALSACRVWNCEILNLPWNFLSRIICDNFLSTSPYKEKRKKWSKPYILKSVRWRENGLNGKRNLPLTVW